MATEVSVVMLKPDGYARGEVRAALKESLARSDLEVVTRYSTVLTEVDVLDIWPKFKAGVYPVGSAMIRRYATSGPIEVWVLTGEGAVKKCRAARDELRARFGTLSFANLAHAPGNAAEAGPNVAKFMALERGTDCPQDNFMSRKRGVWGPLANLPLAEIESAADLVWSRAQEDGWGHVWRPDLDGSFEAVATYEVIWRHRPIHTIDSIVSALCDAMPWAGAADGLGAFVLMEVFGSAPVASGDALKMSNVVARLQASRVPATVRESCAAPWQRPVSP